MGCAASAPVSLEACMLMVQANPAKGLPLINFELGKPMEEEKCKANAPKVFELLPKALGSLTVEDKDKKAVTAACAVIARCVNLVNDPGVGTTSPTIGADAAQQCTTQLVSLMKKALTKGRATHNEHFMEDETCSSDVTAIAGAIKALLKIDDHAAACRNAFHVGGMTVAMSCVATSSGLTIASQQALVSMFATLLESPDSVQPFIGAQGTYALVGYAEDPKTYGANREFQQLCADVLETCINSGKEIKNKAQVEDAIQKAKAAPESGWAKTFSKTNSQQTQ